ncbi:MAG TPA: type II secretion system F family protein [Actinomycetales bacterium]|nr:type II secretion system F family protein [Actinomycetales bacterium]
MPTDLILVLGTGAVGTGLLVLVVTLALTSSQPTGVARSLAVIEQLRRDGQLARHELPAKERLLVPMLDRFQRLGAALSPSGAAATLQRRLDFAGNPGSWTVERLLGAKGLLLVVAAVFGGLLGGVGLWGLLLAAGLGALGFFLPDLLVYNKGLHRQDEIRRSLSNALDMLTVSVEAGLGFDAALMQVARATSGPLAGEFARVLQEIRIGKSRLEAFTAMGYRTDVNELRTFITALSQADRLGIPVAGVLREQSKEMRVVRRQLAEEKAQKVPVKILFPLIFCIFPALFVVIIGPGAIRIVALFTSRL